MRPETMPMTMPIMVLVSSDLLFLLDVFVTSLVAFWGKISTRRVDETESAVNTVWWMEKLFLS